MQHSVYSVYNPLASLRSTVTDEEIRDMSPQTVSSVSHCVMRHGP